MSCVSGSAGGVFLSRTWCVFQKNQRTGEEGVLRDLKSHVLVQIRFEHMDAFHKVPIALLCTLLVQARARSHVLHRLG